MAASKPNALWVFADPSNPKRNSFNHQLLAAGRDVLGEQYEVEVSDLNADGFDARLTTGDLGDFAKADRLFVDLMADAYAANQLPAEVVREQEKLSKADLLILQFPLWWYGPPAILKGWIDRVLTKGFAFGGAPDPQSGLPRRYGDGQFAGRKALLVVTAGEDSGSIGPRGVSGDIESLLFPITHGVLWYIGMSSYHSQIFYDVNDYGQERAEAEIQNFERRLRGLGQERPIPYRTLKSGDYSSGRALNPSIFPGRTDLGIHQEGE